MTDLIDRARAGDSQAFSRLVDPHRRELQLHCYRILGSVQDAEDALQEVMVAAWQGLSGFEARASIRTWLYRIATSRCLNALRARERRPRTAGSPSRLDAPAPSRIGEAVWLEPYPDLLLGGLSDCALGPEARYESLEAVSLAFTRAVQLLPPRQRAVLILRDVLGFQAQEVAHFLECSQESVTSALKRARGTLQRTRAMTPRQQPPPPDSAEERRLVAELTLAYRAADVQAVVCLLTDDVLLTMPPLPMEYLGLPLAVRFHADVTFRGGRTIELVATRANGQPAFGMYVPDPHTAVLHANGLLVLTLAGDRISEMTRFDNNVLAHFGLPRLLPA